MDSTLLSLLGAFLLSIIGLFAFIGSMGKGMLAENPRAASVIFDRGEIGKVDDPASGDAARESMQLYNSGADVVAIRAAIERRWAPGNAAGRTPTPAPPSTKK